MENTKAFAIFYLTNCFFFPKLMRFFLLFIRYLSSMILTSKCCGWSFAAATAAVAAAAAGGSVALLFKSIYKPDDVFSANRYLFIRVRDSLISVD